MTTALPVAIVGCGIIGATTPRPSSQSPGLRIAAVVDPIAPAADGLADLVGGRPRRQRPAVDAHLPRLVGDVTSVVICTPSGTHVDLAEQALAAGPHVVLEKPLDVSMDARPPARRCGGRRRGARTRRLGDQPAPLRSGLRGRRAMPRTPGGFGRVTSAVASVAWWRSQEYYDSGAWRGTWELDGGGALMNQGVHTVDLLLWFLGRPVEVFAHTGGLAHERIEIEDVVAATVTFESGALAVLHATTAAFPGLSVRIQIHGSEGSAVIDDDQLGAFYSGGSDVERPPSCVPASERVGGAKGAFSFVDAHARQYRDIEDGDPHRPRARRRRRGRAARARRRAGGLSVGDARPRRRGRRRARRHTG